MRKFNKLILSTICLSIILCTGCSELKLFEKDKGSNNKPPVWEKNKNNNTQKETETEKNIENVEENASNTLSGDYSENIIYSEILSTDNSIALGIKNNNNATVDIDIEVEFYDNAGRLVGTSSESMQAIAGGFEFVTEIYDTPKEYDNYKVYIDVRETESTKSYFDNIEINHNPNNEEKELLMQVQNNSEDTIETIGICVIYFNGDKPVGVDSDVEFDIMPGRSANFTSYYPYDENYDTLVFDNYKIYVNQAYSYTN